MAWRPAQDFIGTGKLGGAGVAPTSRCAVGHRPRHPGYDADAEVAADADTDTAEIEGDTK
ncbi:hypothetical protein SHIRM173S_05801 [Streptomyces hirsutus]